MAILTVSNGHTMIWSWSRVEGFNHITQKKPSQKKMKNSTVMNINIQMGIPVPSIQMGKPKHDGPSQSFSARCW